ncbi:MAG: SET domain-containing protein-lysine N-methyltransferase [Candidatus Thorarchaeota archaeon]
MSTNDFLEVKFISSNKGRGLFAKKNIEKGKVIDVAYVILISNTDRKQIKKTRVANYCFYWENPKYKSEYKVSLAMTICQFINHSFRPNVKYEINYKNDTIKFTTIRDIKKGEELTMNYNKNSTEKSPVWYDFLLHIFTLIKFYFYKR